MKTLLTRRSFAAVAGALGGSMMVGCDRETYLPPLMRSGPMGMADALTMASQRLLLSREKLVKEYDPRDITPAFPAWGETNPDDDDFQRLRRSDFVDWRLPIGGLINRPVELSLEQIQGLERHSQITMHVCEEGWSAIAQWTGATLKDVLNLAGGVAPEARYVVIDTYDGWYEGYDLFDVVHPQTLLAYGMNGKVLPLAHGAPLRLRVERHCGYKSLKYVKSIRAVASMVGIGEGTGGVNSDNNWHWYAGA